jgi:hypothetical protein
MQATHNETKARRTAYERCRFPLSYSKVPQGGSTNFRRQKRKLNRMFLGKTFIIFSELMKKFLISQFFIDEIE